MNNTHQPSAFYVAHRSRATGVGKLQCPSSPAGTMEATLRSAFRIKGEKAEGHVTRVNTRVLPPRDTRADSARASASVVKLFIYRVSRQKGEEEKRGKNEGVEWMDPLSGSGSESCNWDRMERDGEGEVWRKFGNPRVENINREGRTGTFYHGQVGCCSCAFEQEIFLSLRSN